MSSPPRIRVARLRPEKDADIPLPSRATPGSAGFDLRAAVDGNVTLQPGERVAIPTGLWLSMPPGFEGQVRPRSGLALKHGIAPINSPGTIDSDYRGELLVPLWNGGPDSYTVSRGDRVAQLIIAPVVAAEFEVVDAVADLDSTTRGADGFGSTGR